MSRTLYNILWCGIHVNNQIKLKKLIAFVTSWCLSKQYSFSKFSLNVQMICFYYTFSGMAITTEILTGNDEFY